MKRILVSLDQSSNALHVLKSAAQLAESTHAKLILFRAISIPTELPVAALSMLPQDIQPMLERLATEDLHELSQNVPQNLLAGIQTRFISPWKGICEVAKEEKVDLIVIGAHGYGVFERMVGTTAAKVINHSDRSVLVVRSPELLTS